MHLARNSKQERKRVEKGGKKGEEKKVTSTAAIFSYFPNSYGTSHGRRKRGRKKRERIVFYQLSTMNFILIYYSSYPF